FEAVADELWLNLAPEQDVPAGGEGYARVVRDAQAFAGPMAGLAAILSSADDGAIVAVTAVDMPVMTAEVIARLSAMLNAKPQAAGIMIAWPRGLVEPMPSVWRAASGRRVIEAAMSSGIRG